MMTLTLCDFVTAIDTAVAPIFDAEGEIFPMWHIVTASGTHEVLPSMGCDKDVMAIVARNYFKQNNVVRYVFIDEAWQVETTETDMDKVLRTGVESHPDRVEVLMYSAEDDSGHVTARRVITRSKRGKPKLGPLQFEASKWCAGRFVGLLPQRGTIQ
jgi:hypothetical protein